MNEKKRIYDLARELNRDSKDILAICDALKIVYKSHSSTISHEDVERIKQLIASGRRTAQKPQGVTSKSPGMAKAKAPQIVSVHRQQIVGIPKRPVQPPAPPVEAVPPPQPAAATPPVARQPVIEPQAPERSRSISPAVPVQPVTKEVKTVEPPRVPVIPQAPTPPTIAPPVAQPPIAQPPIVAHAVPEAPKPPTAPVAPMGPVKAEVPKPATTGERPSPRVIKSAEEPLPPIRRLSSVVEETESERRGKVGASPVKAPKPPKRLKAKVVGEDDDGVELDITKALDEQSLLARPISRPTAKASASAPAPVQATRFTTSKKRGSSSASQRRRDRRPVEEVKPTSIVLGGNLTVKDLAELMKVSNTEVIKVLFLKGIPVTINQTLDMETAELVATQLGYEVEFAEQEAAAKKTEMLDIEDLDHLVTRPPVVTIMGHVDHGKTSLLDAIRSTKVAQGEAGGITQHIGAYHIDVEVEGHPRQIVFLDTPGHEAFTAMRARGAKVTDITILVVAADDGVMPQTKEAISHARAAGVPMIVAINKIDKPEANPDRVKQELADQGLLAEEWGGDTVMVPVSAKSHLNLDKLLEMIVLVADVQELSANPDRRAKGTVIEANLDKAKGPVATILVQNGTIRVGDPFVVGSVYGKVRALFDDRSRAVESAGPSMPVEVLGFSDVPGVGDELEVYADEREARLEAEKRALGQRENRLAQAMATSRVTLGMLSSQAKEGDLKELNLIVKGDMQGSVEAILGSLAQLPQDQVQLKILLSAAGDVSEADVDLAAASGAIILGFNTTLGPAARAAAERSHVTIQEYDVIYKLLEDVRDAMAGKLEPEMVEESLGVAEVRQIISIAKGAVAGCMVKEGKISRSSNIRVRRGKEVVYEGYLESLRRFQEDVKEVNAGFECGIRTAFNDWKEGDLIEVYRMVTQKRSL
ncbi:MAG: translation initiation factor IF-2 [Gloeobacterales cyanobacterium]